MFLKQFVAARLELIGSLRRPILCMILLAFASAPALAPIRDNDVWAHISTGEWMLEHHAVPATDPFSANGDQKPWVAYYWIFSLLIFAAYKNLGLVGLLYVKLALNWLIAFALFRLVRRTTHRLELAVGLCCVALAAMYPTLSYARSWLLTICFFLVVLDVLLELRRNGNVLRAWWLPLVFVIWANSHIHFVFGLWAIGLFAIEPVIDGVVHRSPNKTLVGVMHEARPRFCLLAACLAATFLNAYGWGLYGVLLNYGNESQFLDLVRKFRAPSFRFLPEWLMLGIGLLACFLLGWQRRLPTFHVLLFATATYVSFQSARDAWMLAIVGILIVADFDWSKQFSSFAADVKSYDGRSALAVLLLTGGLLLATFRFEPYLSKRVAESFPEDAAAFVEQQQLEGPLFNNYSWGGFLLWRLPNLPVAIDGRAHVHGLAAVDKATKIWMGRRDWKSSSDLNGARLIIGPNDVPLFSLLRTDPRFQLVYEDELAAVFVAAR